MNTHQLIADATTQLTKAGCATPRLDAEILLCHAWHISRSELIIRMPDDVPAEIKDRFRQMLVRRQRREPVAYIIGEKEFWSRSFRVDRRVLIPRPETEHLVESLLQLYPDKRGAFRFCDIGTGSGCIAVTLAREYPYAHITATDVSEDALDVARYNARRHGAGNITFRCGSMFDALAADDGPFDAILSNPPYIALQEYAGLEAELAHEPRVALTDEADGRHFLQQLVEQAPAWLARGGYLLVETGLSGLPGSTEAMILQKKVSDLAGHLRVGIYRRRLQPLIDTLLRIHRQQST
ncbi:MAG: peptide chain release factor N(5)-glutamine methyltransferase [Mariprofundaceae bacterium]|nr:peptide chain release factor N(5)-glutamine methyltransferase [Mariprofundaceae bacterium]